MTKDNRGFTILELIVTMGIFAIIASLTTINLSNSQRIASLSSITTTLVTDLKQQQTKAMTGDTEGRGYNSKYGIHFDNNQYVLFYGDTYDFANSSNFIVPLEGSYSFTTIGEIIFSKISGEKTGLSSVTIKDNQSSQQKIIQLNNYGVITDIN